MEEHVYLITLGIVFGTVILVFGMRAFASVQQAKARIAAEQSFRLTAEQAAAAQTETAAVLASIRASLADMQARLASVEKTLKDVG
jgi:Tfp pilus assembly protein PilO